MTFRITGGQLLFGMCKLNDMCSQVVSRVEIEKVEPYMRLVRKQALIQKDTHVAQRAEVVYYERYNELFYKS